MKRILRITGKIILAFALATGLFAAYPYALHYKELNEYSVCTKCGICKRQIRKTYISCIDCNSTQFGSFSNGKFCPDESLDTSKCSHTFMSFGIYNNEWPFYFFPEDYPRCRCIPIYFADPLTGKSTHELPFIANEISSTEEIATARRYLKESNYHEALRHFENAADFASKTLNHALLAYIRNQQAWLLSTCPDCSYRNGEKAVLYAKMAEAIISFPHFHDSPIMDCAPPSLIVADYQNTLAAAYAQNKDFAYAAMAQKNAIENLNTLRKSHANFRQTTKNSQVLPIYQTQLNAYLKNARFTENDNSLFRHNTVWWNHIVARGVIEKRHDDLVKKINRANPIDYSEVCKYDMSQSQAMSLQIKIDPNSLAVNHLRLNYSHVGKDIANLSFLKSMKLEYLAIDGTPVSDISFLTGMPLTHLSISGTKVSDISVIKGMPLKYLNISRLILQSESSLKGLPLDILHAQGTKSNTHTFDLNICKELPLKKLNISCTEIYDLSPLKGMQLEWLDIGGTKVNDLSPLKDMPLKFLDIHNTPVADLSPLKNMGIKRIILPRNHKLDLTPVKGAAIY